METPNIVIQAVRAYSLRGFAGMADTFDKASLIDQAEGMNFARSFPMSIMDERPIRFANGVLQYIQNDNKLTP